MQFLNPLVLFGLIAAAIPLLLHLLNLRKLKNLEFSSLKFVKELQKTKIRRIKIKQILLLILRTLLIIFIVLAFARPTTETAIPGFESYAGRSTVILLDNSFSKEISDEYGNRFTQAKTASKEILNLLKDGDEAAIINIADLNSPEQYAFSENIEFSKENIDKTEVANKSANLSEAMKFTSILLEDAKHLNKEVFIISDNQENVYKFPSADSNLVNLDANIYNVGVSNSKSIINNYSIDSIKVITKIFQIEKPVEVEIFITNHSQSDVTGLVCSMSFNKQRISQRTLDIPANSSIKTSLTGSPKEVGVVKATIEIENDAFDKDNIRHFGFMLPKLPKVALVGNRQSTSFTSAFVNQFEEKGKFADFDLLSISDFSGTDLTNYELLILAGGEYSESDFRRVSQYTNEGGSILIFANPYLEKGKFVEFCNLLEISNLNYTEPDSEAEIQFIDYDRQHPLFEGVFEQGEQKQSFIESASISNAIVTNSGTPIITMQEGAFMSEFRLGLGKLIYIATPPTLEWSRLPLTGLFPTLIYRSTVYLSAKEDISYPVSLGESTMINIPARYVGDNNFKIIDPKGNEFFKNSLELPSGNVIKIDDFRFEGVYEVRNSNDRVISLLSANLEADESKLTPLNNEEITEKLNYISNSDIEVNFIEQNANIQNQVLTGRAGTELWKIFVILALLTALAEMIVQRTSKAELE